MWWSSIDKRYFGGSLNQNINNHDLNDKLHKINIKENTFLYEIYNSETYVNSFHHQSVKEGGKWF